MKPNGKGPDQDPEGVGGEHPYAQGLNGLLNAVASVIDTERVVHAVGSWVDSHSENMKQKSSYQWRSFITSLLFSLLIFVGIAVLAWFDKIPKEATTALFGSLIGYWFGRSQATKER
jgi:hypothetical protein